MKPSCGLRPGDTPPERPDKPVPPAKGERTAPARETFCETFCETFRETFQREYGGEAPYEDPIALLRDIRDCVLQSVTDSVEHGNHSGPWLPRELNVRIRRVLFRDTVPTERPDRRDGGVQKVGKIGKFEVYRDVNHDAPAIIRPQVDKPVHGGYPDALPVPTMAERIETARAFAIEYGRDTFTCPCCKCKVPTLTDHICMPRFTKKLAEVKEVLDPIAADIYARTGNRIEVAAVVGGSLHVTPGDHEAHRKAHMSTDLITLRPLKFLGGRRYEAEVAGFYSLKHVSVLLRAGEEIVAEEDGTFRCPDCGAGDDAHHSYSCPTGLHQQTPGSPLIHPQVVEDAKRIEARDAAAAMAAESGLVLLHSTIHAASGNLCAVFEAPCDGLYHFKKYNLTVRLRECCDITVDDDQRPPVRCPDCGAADDNHHSYSCPTGLHQQTPGGPLIHQQVVEDVKALDPYSREDAIPVDQKLVEEAAQRAADYVRPSNGPIVSHREDGVPPDTFKRVGRLLPGSRLKAVKGVASDTFAECTHYVAPISSYYRIRQPHGLDLTFWLKAGDSVRRIGGEFECPDCGAGDDDHHSYSCPTGLHADLVARDEEEAVAGAVGCTCDPGCVVWSEGCPVHDPHLNDVGLEEDEGDEVVRTTEPPPEERRSDP